MRFGLVDGTLGVVSRDLPLYGTRVPLDVGEIPPCEMSIDGITTDMSGNLNLPAVLDWWQPPAN